MDRNTEMTSIGVPGGRRRTRKRCASHIPGGDPGTPLRVSLRRVRKDVPERATRDVFDDPLTSLPQSKRGVVLALGALVGVEAHDRETALQHHAPLAWLMAAPRTEPSHTPTRQNSTETRTLAAARSMSPSRASVRVCRLKDEKVV